jgi:hypothetical protein
MGFPRKRLRRMGLGSWTRLWAWIPPRRLTKYRLWIRDIWQHRRRSLLQRPWLWVLSFDHCLWREQLWPCSYCVVTTEKGKLAQMRGLRNFD